MCAQHDNRLGGGADQELERRGLRVMEGLVGLYATLKLQVNVAKSAVAPVWERSFLGFRFWRAPGKIVKCRVAPKALTAMKERVREITARCGGRRVTFVATELRKYLVGWKAYFHPAETPSIFADVDKWIHRRLRALILKQWKRGRTVYRELRRRGVGGKTVPVTAHYSRHWWRASRFAASTANACCLSFPAPLDRAPYADNIWKPSRSAASASRLSRQTKTIAAGSDSAATRAAAS